MNAGSGWRREKKHLLRSCESCRFSKTKCIPHDMPDEKCHRCARLDKHCVFSESRDRKKRATAGQTRIIEVEKKVDSIYSLLQTGPVRQNRPVPQPPETLTPQSLTSGECVSRESEGSPFQDASPNASHVTSSSPYCEEASVSVDVFQLGIITVHEAEVLLDTSLLEYGDFPWVILPARLPLDLFRREKPILLLSLLALASRRQALLHDSLVREFKNIISAKVIMDGSPDLDLLQGLLLYLAWFHLHPKVQSKKYSMLAQIAIAISADLDLPRLIVGDPNGQLKAELERTYVGVYYISSCNSTVSRKPVRMKYDDFVGDCCRSLATSNNTPTDADLLHFIGLQRLTEEVASTFRYDSINEGRQLRMDNVELSVKAFKSRLHDLRCSFPSNNGRAGSLMLAYENTNIYIHEVSLHVEQSIGANSMPLRRELEDSSQRRISLLLECLEATKTFLDCFLRIPPEAVIKHSSIERGQLAYAVTMLMKMAFHTSSGLDFLSLRDACNVSYYLDAMAEHLASASASANVPDEGCPDSFSAIKTMAGRIKSWYESTAFFEQTGTASAVKGMSAMQVVEIAEEEQQLTNFDLGNMDFAFLEAGNFFD